MFPCPSCKRHLREHELHCPFCRADVQRANVVASLALTALGLLGGSACSSNPSSDDGQSTTTNASTNETGSSSTDTTTDTTTDTATTADTETSTNTDDSATDTWESSGSFYAVPSDISTPSQCDQFLQDCPEGEKCVPYASSGQSWDANKCVPITGTGQAGAPCFSGGIVEATDDCDASSMCWHVQDVDGQLIGVCTEFCQGSADAPTCPDGDTCVISNQGSINLCLDGCDPLAQDCGEGYGCMWLTDAFVCTLASEDPIGAVCDFLADCPSGTTCVAAELLPECAGATCCAAYCSLAAPTCAVPGTECAPFFEEGLAPPEYADLGICVLPG